MADDDTKPDMTKVWRGVHGPRPIAALVPRITRGAFSSRGPGIGQLLEAWSGIVGPALAQTTAPRRLAQGTLTIGCSGPVAMELQHLSVELISRINQYLGVQSVHRLRFVQTLTAPNRPRPRPPLDPAVQLAASRAVANLPEGPLRDALTSLGRAVLTESASRLGKQTRTRC
jgi:hypothetical protein